jgi:hypothetical protein
MFVSSHVDSASGPSMLTAYILMDIIARAHGHVYKPWIHECTSFRMSILPQSEFRRPVMSESREPVLARHLQSFPTTVMSADLTAAVGHQSPDQPVRIKSESTERIPE